MEKSEFRVLIKRYFLRGKTLSESKAKIDKHYLDSAPSYGMVQKWFTEFHCGRTSTETLPSPGRLNKITTPEMSNKIHNIVLNDPKVKVREIAEIVSISTEHVVNILQTHLCMRICVTTSEQYLALFNCNPKEFIRRFVTMDGAWIHHYTLESREGSKQ